MKGIENQTRSTIRLVARGAKLGLISGAFLSSAYAALALITMGLLIAFGSLPSGGGLFALPLMGAVLFCGGLFSSLLGFLPGVILGITGGSVTGMLIAILPPMPRQVAWLPGSLCGLGLAAGLHLLLGPGFLGDYAAGRSNLLPYVFWVIGPSFLLTTGLGWVSLQLARIKTAG